MNVLIPGAAPGTGESAKLPRILTVADARPILDVCTRLPGQARDPGAGKALGDGIARLTAA